MPAYRGFLGDEGPWSFYNVVRAMTLFGATVLTIWTWSFTPWFPWK